MILTVGPEIERRKDAETDRSIETANGSSTERCTVLELSNDAHFVSYRASNANPRPLRPRSVLPLKFHRRKNSELSGYSVIKPIRLPRWFVDARSKPTRLSGFRFHVGREASFFYTAWNPPVGKKIASLSPSTPRVGPRQAVTRHAEASRSLLARFAKLAREPATRRVSAVFRRATGQPAAV